MMKFLRVVSALLLLGGAAHAQGLIQPGQVMGNSTAARALPVPTSLSALIDRLPGCTTQGSIIYRGTTTQNCLNPSTAGTAIVSGGAGANLAYTASPLGTAAFGNIGSQVEAWSANLDAFALKTAPSGVVVGTTDSQALTNKTYNGNTWTAGTGVLTIGAGKTATISNTLTMTGTDGSSVNVGTGGTVAYTANNLSVFAATTSAQLAGVLSDETGTGAAVFASAPTFTNPVVGTQTAGDSTTKAASTAFVQTAIAPIGSAVTYSTRTLAIAATVPATVNKLSLTGYATANICPADYIRLGSTPSPIKAWHFQSADGAYWQLKSSTVYPCQVGAVLDGTTDDTTAIQAWVDYSAQFTIPAGGNGGTAVIPTATINLSSNTYIDCDHNLTIKRTSNIPAQLFQADGQDAVKVKNCDFTTTAGFTSTSTVTLAIGTQVFTVPAGLTGLVPGNILQITANSGDLNNYENAFITSYSGTTLTVSAYGFSVGGTFSNWFINSYPQNGNIAPSPIALEFVRSTNSLAEGNKVTGKFYNGIDSRNGIRDRILYNDVSGVVNRGIHLAAYTFASSQSQIVGNTINGGLFTTYCINVSGTDSGVVQELLISGNAVNNCTHQGINISGSVTLTSVTGNSVVMKIGSTVAIGILSEGILPSSLPITNVIANNTIYGSLIGIYVVDASYGTISGNNLTQAGEGIEIASTNAVGGGAFYFTVTGNTMRNGSGNGLNLAGAIAGSVTGIAISGNNSIANGGWGFIGTNTSNVMLSGNLAIANTLGTYSITGSTAATNGNIP